MMASSPGCNKQNESGTSSPQFSGAQPGFSKEGSHCIKVMVITRLSWHFGNLLQTKGRVAGTAGPPYPRPWYRKFGGDYAKNISEENSASLACLTCFVQLKERLVPANFPPFHIESLRLGHTEMTTSSYRYLETIIPFALVGSVVIYHLVSNVVSWSGSKSHGVMAAILVFQNDETAAMLVYQTNPVGVQLFFYVDNFFVPINLHGCWTRECIRSIIV